MPFAKGNKLGGKKKNVDGWDEKRGFQMMLPKCCRRLALLAESEDDRVALDAIKVVLDRALGKAPQAIDLKASEGLKVNVNVTVEGSSN